MQNQRGSDSSKMVFLCLLSIPVFGHQVAQFVRFPLLARVMQVDDVSVQDLT